jgi:hypothetical protein
MNRRRFLVGAACLAGCPARLPPDLAELPEGPVALGWRWVPGMELAYRTVVVRSTAGIIISRAEQWTYRVRDLDRNDIATLEGRLTAFGAGVEVDGDELPAAWLETPSAQERTRSASPVTFRMGMDGRLSDLSVTDIDRALPHQMLGLRVPTTPVLPYDEWSDLGIARPFTRLLPPRFDPRVQGSARLVELHHRGAGTRAAIDGRGSIRVTAGPSITITTSASWDADHGVLAERDQTVRFLPTVADRVRDPGELTLTLRRA